MGDTGLMHSLTHTYILAYTTIKRTKHNKKRSPVVFLAHCGGEQKVCCTERLQGEVSQRGTVQKNVTISDSYWISYDTLLITNSLGSSSH